MGTSQQANMQGIFKKGHSFPMLAAKLITLQIKEMERKQEIADNRQKQEKTA